MRIEIIENRQTHFNRFVCDMGLGHNTPDLSMGHNIPDMGLGHNTPDLGLGHNTPAHVS